MSQKKKKPSQWVLEKKIIFFKMQKEKRKRPRDCLPGKAATGRTLLKIQPPVSPGPGTQASCSAPTVGLSLSRSPTISKQRETPLEDNK